MQLAHLAVEQVARPVGRGRVPPLLLLPRALEVSGHHLQVVEAAQQVLESLQCIHEPQRRHTAEFVDQLERVAQLLRPDSHLVQPLDRKQRAGVGDGRVEPVHSSFQPSPEQQRARLARRAAGRVDQAGELLEERGDLDLLHLPCHLVLALAAIGLDRTARRRDDLVEVGVVQAQGIEDAERDVEFPDAAQRGGQLPQTTAQLPDGCPAAGILLKPEHRQDLTQAAGGHAGPMKPLDVAFERRGQLTFEGADAARERALRQ